MPIPLNAHQVSGQPNRVRLDDGSVVTRHQALNLGAQYMGYKNHIDYRSHATGDAKYVEAWLRTPQGRAALAQERQQARTTGNRFNRAQMTQRIIAFRNGRPHPRSQQPASQAHVDFLSRYGFTTGRDYVRY